MPRGRILAALLLASCFPDADKLRSESSPPHGTAGIGGGAPAGGAGGGIIGIGGAAGGTGGAAGGAGGTGGAPGGMARAQACADYASAVVAKSQQCSPFVTPYLYGTAAVHAMRIQVFCNIFDLPAVTFPPRPARACADAIAQQSCETWFEGPIPAACRAAGQLADGASCATGFQCQNDYCDLPDAGGCGRCTRPPGLNQPCPDDVCATGLVCGGASVCVTPRTLGAACNDANPCRSSLFCRRGVCSTPGVAGTACLSDQECDPNRGVFCNEARGACVTVTLGQMCRANTDGGFVFCGGGAFCRQDGACVPPAQDGAACSDQMGPACLWPARCVDSRCRLPQPDRMCTAAARLPEHDFWQAVREGMRP